MGKLSKQQILEIYNAEGVYKEIAKQYGVSSSCVTHIKTGLRHSHITGATENNNNRKREPSINKAQAQAIYDFIKDPDDPKTQEEAAVYFSLPKYTIRRVMLDYVKKFRIRNVKK